MERKKSKSIPWWRTMSAREDAVLGEAIVFHSCLVCGKHFVATRRGVYCSAACKQAAYRQRKREVPQ